MHKFSFEQILNYAQNFQFSRLNTWNDDNKNICNWFFMHFLQLIENTFLNHYFFLH